MFSKDFEMERKVAKCKATLVRELNAAYKQQQKDGDWEAFGERIKGIYISYSTCDNEIYHRAMRDVLAGSTKDSLNPEIISGNYGLRVQVYKTIKDELKIMEDMKKRYGEKVVERYLRSFNECQTYALCVAIDDKKKIKEQFNTLVETLVKMSSRFC